MALGRGVRGRDRALARGGLRRGGLLLPAGHEHARGGGHTGRVRARVVRRVSRPPPSKSRAMARKKRPSKVRPKTPSRVKKRTTRKASRGHHHPELIGLGLAAFGLFMGSVLYVGWNGGYVGKAIGDGLISVVGGIAYVLPVACTTIGVLMVARSDLPRFGPFRTGLVVTTVGLAMVLGRGARRVPGRGAREAPRQPDRHDRHPDPRRLPAPRRRAARQRRLGRRVPAPLGPRRCGAPPGGGPRGASDRAVRAARSRSPRRCSPPRRRRSTACRSSRTSSRRRRCSSSTRSPSRSPRTRPRPRSSTSPRPTARTRLHAPRPERAAPLEAGREGHRRVQRPRRRGARPGARELRRRRDRRRRDRRPARHALRAPARPGDEGLEGRRAEGRPLLRARDDRDPHPRADPRQAGGRRRGAEPLAEPRHARRHLRRPARDLEPAVGLARQGHLRPRGLDRPRAHAAPADRRHDRLGQVGLHQHDPHLDPAARDAGRRADDPDRPEADRAQLLRVDPAPAHAGRLVAEAGGRRAG